MARRGRYSVGMTAAPDEDEAALSWAGDDAPPAGPAAKHPVAPPAEARPATPAALLVSYGILGGIYLIYTIGWVVAIQRLGRATVASSEPLTQIMLLVSEVLAVASPAIWFGTAVILTRAGKPIRRLLAILLGLVAVLPWPFVLGAWL